MLEYLKLLVPIVVAAIALGQGFVVSNTAQENYQRTVENCLRINDLKRIARELILLSPLDPDIAEVQREARRQQLELLEIEDC